jgi:thiamine-phosphate pyrophosphorylase
VRPHEQIDAARIYLITDASPRVLPIERFLSEAVAGGVGMVQLRERCSSDQDLLAVAQRCARTCRQLGIPFIVNDRLDIALACGADGVHLGQDDLPAAAARRIAPDAFIIGLSTHSAQQIDASRELDVDYIGVGPIHETPTKQGRPAVGVELVRYASIHACTPFFAIGGLDPANVRDVIDAGGRRVSILRWIAQAADPKEAARQLATRMQQASRAPVS